MGIKKNTQDELILQDRPWLTALAFVIMIIGALAALVMDWDNSSLSDKMLLVGMAAVIAFVGAWFIKIVRCRFDRTAKLVCISRGSLLGRKRMAYPLEHFKEARLDADASEGATYRLVFVFDEAMIAEGYQNNMGGVKRDSANLPPNEVCYTEYYTGRSYKKEIAAIEGWLKI